MGCTEAGEQTIKEEDMSTTLISRFSDIKEMKLERPIISIYPCIEKYVKNFILGRNQIVELMHKFQYSLDNGLSAESNVVMKSSLKMIPTFLHDVPNSTQTGRYVALDLGGTNLRFFIINLMGDKFSFSSNQFVIPLKSMHGTKDDLFDFIANALKEGLDQNHLENEFIPFVGFTFSFPVLQTSLFSGKLITWSKGFKTEGVEGQDISKLMLEASAKLGLNIGKFVLINDTTGTLLSGALHDSHCAIGIINGTGTNACYIEDLKKVSKFNDTDGSNNSQILINTEWGGLGTNGEMKNIQTEYDIELDSQSTRPGHHRYEKMISGMYLGEIARLVMIDLTKNKMIFDGKFPQVFNEAYSLDTRYISQAYNIPEMVQSFKDDFKITLSKNDADVLSSLFDVIVFRSAQLLSATLAVLIRRINRHSCTVAVDGSLFKKNPFYMSYVNKMIKHLVRGRRFHIIDAEDGSGKGAALAAAVATRSFKDLDSDFAIGYY